MQRVSVLASIYRLHSGKSNRPELGIKAPRFQKDKTTFTNLQKKTNKKKTYEILNDTDFKSAMSKLNKQHEILLNLSSLHVPLWPRRALQVKEHKDGDVGKSVKQRRKR